jgi:hypothetical protein
MPEASQSQKYYETLIGDLRKTYGADFAKGCADNEELSDGAQEKKRPKYRVCGNGVPQPARHLFRAAQFRSYERRDDEACRDQPHPHHERALAQPDVQNVSDKLSPYGIVKQVGSGHFDFL